jgi:hypothetical protein
MKRLLFCLALLLVSCVKKPQTGTAEWTNEQYSNALLQTNYDSMRKYAIPDTVPPPPPLSLKDRLKGLHIVKQCPITENADKTSYTTLILIAGAMDDSVYGVQITTVKQDADWKVEHAIFSVDAQGIPKRYLRNCGEDSSAEKKPLNGPI